MANLNVQPEILMDRCYHIRRQLREVYTQKMKLLQMMDELNRELPNFPALERDFMHLDEEFRAYREIMEETDQTLEKLTEELKAILPPVVPFPCV